MPHDTIALAELRLPPRLHRACSKQGWRTIGDLEDALADGVLGRIPRIGTATVALAVAVCKNPEQWRRSRRQGASEG